MISGPENPPKNVDEEVVDPGEVTEAEQFTGSDAIVDLRAFPREEDTKDEKSEGQTKGKNVPVIRRPEVGKNKELTWEGLPYEGPVYDFKNDDPEERLPQLRHRVRTDLLDMSKQEDRDKYAEIAGDAIIGKTKLIHELHRENSTGAWNYLVTWASLYYVAPEPRG